MSLIVIRNQQIKNNQADWIVQERDTSTTKQNPLSVFLPIIYDQKPNKKSDKALARELCSVSKNKTWWVASGYSCLAEHIIGEKMEIKTNVIYCGDCKDNLKKLPDDSVDLMYLDPPFFSDKNYENIWIDKETKFFFTDKDWEKLKNTIDPNILKEYEHIEQRWKGGKKGMYVYIAYMRERLEQCCRVLKSTGSIFLHCDWHASHYLKVMMDEIFGYNNFRNEIVWSYQRWTNNSSSFQRTHDILLFYTKSDKYTFNQLTEEYSKKSQHKGARFSEMIDGKLVQNYTEDTARLKAKSDVWEISILNSQSKERLGYPTQKPEALLELIIKASSNENDIVLDGFCGCGTALAVANKLNRKWIGMDISRTACNLMKKRLGGNVKIIGGETIAELKLMKPHEFAYWVISEKMSGTPNPKKSGDLGIDGWIEFKTIPVQVKQWGNKVGRPEIDKFKTAIERDHKTKGIIVGFDFSKDCYGEIARIKKDHNIEIELKKVTQL